jgi:hypothetical protein
MEPGAALYLIGPCKAGIWLVPIEGGEEPVIIIRAVVVGGVADGSQNSFHNL